MTVDHFINEPIRQKLLTIRSNIIDLKNSTIENQNRISNHDQEVILNFCTYFMKDINLLSRCIDFKELYYALYIPVRDPSDSHHE